MRTREILREARLDGAAAGRAAASWVFDGNSSLDAYKRVLRGIKDGDPEILDAYRLPDLSGEFADEPTPQTLRGAYGLDDNEERWEALEADICNAWETACHEAFWSAVEKTCRAMIGDDK